MTVPPGAEFVYQARRHREFAALRRGDAIVAMVGGRRVRAVVLEVSAPGVIVGTADGDRHVITIAEFGARTLGLAGRDL